MKPSVMPAVIAGKWGVSVARFVEYRVGSAKVMGLIPSEQA